MKTDAITKERNGNYRLAQAMAKETEAIEKLVGKYEDFLQDAYLRTQDGTFRMAEITKEHRISPNVSSVLQSMGLLKSEGSNKKNIKWYWIGNEPDRDIAEKLVEEARNVDKTKRERSKFQKTEELRSNGKIAISELIKPDNDKWELKLKVAKMFARLNQFQAAYEILLTMIEDRE
jgi:hypothetical protein